MIQIKSRISNVPHTGTVLSTLEIHMDESGAPRAGDTRGPVPHQTHWVSTVHKLSDKEINKMEVDTKNAAEQHELCLNWCLLSFIQKQLMEIRTHRQPPSA